MTAESLLAHLERVRQRGPRRWSALCPGHEDKAPSLSISEGNNGILLHCFAGCTLAEVCAALGIAQRDLFFDSKPDGRAVRSAQLRRSRAARADVAAGCTASALRLAEELIRSRRGLEISSWDFRRLDDELAALSLAYNLLEREGLHDR